MDVRDLPEGALRVVGPQGDLGFRRSEGGIVLDEAVRLGAGEGLRVVMG